jgi:hypothetical protein
VEQKGLKWSKSTRLKLQSTTFNLSQLD